MRSRITPWEELALAEDLLHKRSPGKRVARLGKPSVRAWPSARREWTLVACVVVGATLSYFFLGGWWAFGALVVGSGVVFVASRSHPTVLAAVMAHRRTATLRGDRVHGADALQTELEARRTWWLQQMDRPDAWRLRRALSGVRPSNRRAAMVYTAAVIIFASRSLLYAGSNRPAPGVLSNNLLWVLALTGVAIAYLVWTRMTLSRVNDRIRGALTRSTCVACGYDLSGLRAENDPPGRVLRGPMHCPECACVAPLVPPAIPANFDVAPAGEVR